MHSTNRKSNSLQSLSGIFLQSTHTLQKVIETLVRMGISVSVDAIHAAIRSLSAESHHAMQQLGRTLLAAYAYNNFDIDLKTTTPTIEKSTDTLEHLTSGLLFPLMHGVVREDLRCSRALWERSPLNLHADRSLMTVPRGWEDLLSLQKDLPDNAGLTCRDRFNSWKIMSDLIQFGPSYFSKFKDHLRAPEIIEAVLLVKTPIIAAHAMDLSNSTVSGNISSIVNLLQQGGVENPDNVDDPEMSDFSEYVILFHGDLGTAERIQAAQQCHADEGPS